ncbi:hypothetical protein AVEN_261698-1 [Araneus ventricosus]|uniref:Uncharacterized protein n=1 Tax=Araneus ventricosus TaxID=182803 RepID=A0A4Y2DY87_ARAVE|nr:hypothetical protein AVEN_261698-1 [Araneus ventricosus]
MRVTKESRSRNERCDNERTETSKRKDTRSKVVLLLNISGCLKKTTLVITLSRFFQEYGGAKIGSTCNFFLFYDSVNVDCNRMTIVRETCAWLLCRAKGNEKAINNPLAIHPLHPLCGGLLLPSKGVALRSELYPARLRQSEELDGFSARDC